MSRRQRWAPADPGEERAMRRMEPILHPTDFSLIRRPAGISSSGINVGGMPGQDPLKRLLMSNNDQDKSDLLMRAGLLKRAGVYGN